MIFIWLAFGPVEMYGNGPSCWISNVFFFLISLIAMLLLLPIAILKTGYRLRIWAVVFLFVIFFVSLILPLLKLCGITELSMILNDYPGLLFYGAYLSLIVHILLSAILLSFFSSSRVARLLHPFMERHKIGSGQGKLSTSGSSLHRVPGGLFEDWPDPEPFVAETLYAYRRGSESELSFHRAQLLIILDCRGNWWQARLPETGQVGFVPSNYVQVLQRATVIAPYTARHSDEVSLRLADSSGSRSDPKNGSADAVGNSEVEVMEVHPSMSLVRLPDGRIGSVPTSALALLPLPESAIALQKEIE